jgi:hypothetical protein
VARPQGTEGLGMAGPGETLGSPRPPLVIHYGFHLKETVDTKIENKLEDFEATINSKLEALEKIMTGMKTIETKVEGLEKRLVIAMFRQTMLKNNITN